MFQGLHIHSKQKVNPWDLMEGQKNQGPLTLATFGAVRVERRPLRYEEQHRLGVCGLGVFVCVPF